MFVGSADFRLRRASPCLDAGNSTLALGVLDLALGDRFRDILGLVDIGIGPAPIVDMGAYEASYCIADFDDGSGTGAPDGGVTVDDLLYYLNLYGGGAVAADIDDGNSTGRPDGGVTIDDLLFFLGRFEAGC